MARVYLDTSFVSSCVSTRADAASVYRRDTSLEWMQTQRDLHQVFVSAEVHRELNDPDYPRRSEAMDFIAAIPYLNIDEQVIGLAAVLVREQVMPGPATGDALHVAVSCVHGVEYVLSWNVRHLANPNKMKHLQTICVRAGYAPPRIVTPDLLWEKKP